MSQLWSRLLVTSSVSVALLMGAACSSDSDADDDLDPGSSSGTNSSSSSGTSGRDGGGSSSGSSGVNDPSYAEAPVLQQIEPNRATVGGAGPTLVVRGRNFVPRTVVQLDGAALETSFIDTTELRATMPSDKLAAPGVLAVSVGTSPPGGGASSALDFTVENPVPTLTRVSSPETASAQMNSGAFTLQLEGSGFVPGAKVRWAGSELPTTVDSATRLSAQVDAGKLAVSGGFEIDVINPAPGGGASAKLTFVVTNPTVQLTSMDPTSALVGSSAVQVVLTGSGFVGGSKVRFNGTELTPQVTNATSMSVTVPANLLQTTAVYALYVQNPQPGGGTSDPLLFNVVNPAPRLTSLSPDSAVQGAGITEVTITGTGFIASSRVSINGNPADTTFVDDTRLRFSIPASALQNGGSTLDIRVTNESPGGGSATLPFRVRNGQPTVDTVYAEGVDSDGFVVGREVTVAVRGAGFIGTSTVNVNGTNQITTRVSSTELRATFTPSSTNLVFKVVDTAPSNPGADSNSVTLTACASLTANANPLPSPMVLLSSNDPLFSVSTPVTTVFAGSGTTCGSNIAFRNPSSPTGQEMPYRGYIVQNTSGKAATLEAWAECTGPYDDAYLALYKRTTVPTTEAQRQQCDGRLSNGGAYAPPAGFNPGGSNYCPGLYGANGRTMQACETWVAYIQADTNSFNHTWPARLYIDISSQ